MAGKGGTMSGPDWDTVMEMRAETERDYCRGVCGDRHRWEPDERHAREGYRCAGCGVTEAELDREQYGRAYADGEGWSADEEPY
jgi:hypothetical protein